MQAGDLRAGLHAQLRVQVRERLVHEEHLWLADDSPAESNALALTAGERLRLAVQELLDAEDLRCLLHAGVDLRLGGLAQLEAERHVVVHTHMGVERVALEHHRDVAVLRRDVVHPPLPDEQVTLRDVLQPRDHAERRALAATGRPDEYQELAVLDVDVQVLNRRDVVAAVLLAYVLENHSRHARASFIYASPLVCRPMLLSGTARTWPGGEAPRTLPWDPSGACRYDTTTAPVCQGLPERVSEYRAMGGLRACWAMRTVQ